MKIPFFVQDFTQEMEDAALDALRNESFVGGESVSNFEEEFATYIGTKYAVSVNSGNSALQISLMSLGISYKSKVITPTNSFIASANCIRMVNAQPIFEKPLEGDVIKSQADTSILDSVFKWKAESKLEDWLEITFFK